MLNRESVAVKGVLHVDSFDERELVLDTELGSLSIGGEDLHVRELNLESGHLLLEGMINSLTYSAATKSRKAQGGGLLGRIFR
jgi:sporulation protein YabP